MPAPDQHRNTSANTNTSTPAAASPLKTKPTEETTPTHHSATKARQGLQRAGTGADRSLGVHLHTLSDARPLARAGTAPPHHPPCGSLKSQRKLTQSGALLTQQAALQLTVPCKPRHSHTQPLHQAACNCASLTQPLSVPAGRYLTSATVATRARDPSQFTKTARQQSRSASLAGSRMPLLVVKDPARLGLTRHVVGDRLGCVQCRRAGAGVDA